MDRIRILRVDIRNYRVFRTLQFDLEAGLNVLVGNNNGGKSTLLEAIALGTTGRADGGYFYDTFSEYSLNQAAVNEWLEECRGGNLSPPPELAIDVYLEDNASTASLKGTNNSAGENACGLRVLARPDPDLLAELKDYISSRGARLSHLPVEFYSVEWLGFNGLPMSARGCPLRTSLIDGSRLYRGAGLGHPMRSLLTAGLDPTDRMHLDIAYRENKSQFNEHDAMSRVNDVVRPVLSDLTAEGSVGLDISRHEPWDSALSAHLDGLPLRFSGRGDQVEARVLIATQAAADKSQVVCIEEPENHLSHSRLRQLLRRLTEAHADRQIIVATHSSYVVNVLGLNHLRLMNRSNTMRLTDLTPQTVSYFKRTANFDTLRILLASRAVLVEGPADLLVFNRLYADRHNGRDPIEDEIEVVSVNGLKFKRYLEIAAPLRLEVGFLTDNDDKVPDSVAANYLDHVRAAFPSDDACTDNLYPFVGTKAQGKTLEPQLLAANGNETMVEVLGLEVGTSEPDVLDYMLSNKTEAALAFAEYEGDRQLEAPTYMGDCLDWLG